LRAVIFANGLLADLAWARAALQPADLLIAADGGAKHLQALGLAPQDLIGDLDSLSTTELDALVAAGCRIIRHPARKDFTDLELAIRHAFAAGASEILLLGALGNRWDQTLANLLLAASEQYEQAPIRLLDGPQELQALRGGRSLTLRGLAGDTLSLIPLFGDARGVTTHNLEYPLHDETLTFGSTRGVSNVLLDEEAVVSLREGLLMCVVIHKHQYLISSIQ
jgi:thiamine pyrophosphokinase